MDSSFVVVGDIGSKEGAIEKFEKAVPDLLRYNPTLMVVLGNMVPEGTDRAYLKAYEALEAVNRRYGVAVEATPGSTDLLAGVLPETYRAFFGEPTASFMWGGVKFITLDTSAGKIEAKQIEFLEKHLTTPSFIFTHYPPAVGEWAFDALTEGTEALLAALGERSNLVLGCFFGHIKTFDQGQLTTEGLILNFPAFVVGNGVEAFEVGKFGYSRPGRTGGLSVTLRNGKPTFEPVYTEPVVA
jgi:hypothetical protein